MTDSNRKSAPSKSKLAKPKKPYPDFPLTAHNSGAWMKKIRGKIYYFGRWSRQVKGERVRVDCDGWEEALKLYLAQCDDLHAGRTPRETNTDGLTLAELCNRFLTAKLRKVKSGELGERSFDEYKNTTDLLIAQFSAGRLVTDLAAADFEVLRERMAERWGLTRLANEIQRCRTVFKHGFDNGLIDRPVRFGSEFRRPDKKAMRRHRAQSGKKLLTAEEIRMLLDAADLHLRAMILLGINCGLGNHDIACLTESALDLENAWLDFPRPKTGIARSSFLWFETIEALQQVLEERPDARREADKHLVFLKPSGRSWITGGVANPISIATATLMKKVGCYRKGISFYLLRHTFATIASGVKGQIAVNHCMGHSDGHISATYREEIEPARLQAVADHVHDWLFGYPHCSLRSRFGSS